MQAVSAQFDAVEATPHTMIFDELVALCALVVFLPKKGLVIKGVPKALELPSVGQPQLPLPGGYHVRPLRCLVGLSQPQPQGKKQYTERLRQNTK